MWDVTGTDDREADVGTWRKEIGSAEKAMATNKEEGNPALESSTN